MKNILEAHSIAKIEFYQNYLEKYISILYNAKGIEIINILDMFCGKGLYQNGLGSPLIACEAINSVCNKFDIKNKKFNLIINDLNIEDLKLTVKEIKNRNRKENFNFYYYNLEINNFISTTKKYLDNHKSSVRNLIFFDPYGYKNTTKTNIYTLIKNKKTEIFIFIPISFIHRFKSMNNTEQKQYEPLKKFLDDFIPSDINPESLNIYEFIRLIGENMSFDDKFYTASYPIERSKNNLFALFFISPHIYGLEKVLETKWSLFDGLHDYFTPKIVGLFDEEFKQNKSEEHEELLFSYLKEFLKIEPKSNNQIYEFTLKKGYLPKDLRALLVKKKDYFEISDISKVNGAFNYMDFKNKNIKFNIKLKKNE